MVNWNLNNYLTYEKDWSEKHYFKIMVGQSAQRVKAEGFGLNGWGFPNDYLTSPSDAPSENQSGYSYETGNGLLSFFSRINYKLKNKYLLGISMRGDASSRFGPDNKWGFFPAFSAGWIISDEKFLKGSKAVPFLKLSASFGYTGNDAIPDFAFGHDTNGPFCSRKSEYDFAGALHRQTLFADKRQGTHGLRTRVAGHSTECGLKSLY